MAMLVVGFTATAVVASYNYGFFAMGLARENQRATQVILEKAETIRLYNWEKLNTIPVVFNDAYDPHAPDGKKGVVYHGTCSVGNVPFVNSYSTNLRQVTITLTWTNQTKGFVRTRSLQTLIAADGIQNYVY
jgi:hypothetical protein